MQRLNRSTSATKKQVNKVRGHLNQKSIEFKQAIKQISEEETEGMAWSPDGKLLYATNEAENSISVIDPAQNKIITRIPVERAGNRPRGIAPDGKRPWGAVIR